MTKDERIEQLETTLTEALEELNAHWCPNDKIEIFTKSAYFQSVNEILHDDKLKVK